VIVAGGGIIGLACAWRLARSGLPVTLFDARELAAEASWAAAGMLAPGGEWTRMPRSPPWRFAAWLNIRSSCANSARLPAPL